MINPEKGMEQRGTINLDERVTINLDDCQVEIVKNGKRYSLIEFIENRINDVLDLRMREGGDNDADGS